jgi:probable F420-dependent oxidoreductase
MGVFVNVDVGLWCELSETAARARELELIGYDGIYVPEAGHDPFVPATVVVQSTSRPVVRTGVAVAFPRSPTHLAMVGNDLQALSGGRFQLGLGSQVRSHIEKRFSAPWSEPASRMREMVAAIRAHWRCWNEGEKLDFHGDFYTHTLMTPFFSPPPNPFGAPPILLAALGPKMTEVAGEVADGILLHGLSSERYVREVTVPALERGLASAGRARSEIEFTFPTLIATGESDEEFENSLAKLRQHLAFYASTPTYRPVLELHGWGGLQSDLHRLAKENRWSEMGGLITDEVLDAFTARGEPKEMAGKILRRVGDIADRLSFYSPAAMSTELTARIVADLKAGAAGPGPA